MKVLHNLKKTNNHMNTRRKFIKQTAIGTALNGIEPNPSAGLYKISSVGDDLSAWGIGDNYRIFYTNNGRVSWSEPNPKAGLANISAGID